jgi:hypothetical protein
MLPLMGAIAQTSGSLYPAFSSLWQMTGYKKINRLNLFQKNLNETLRRDALDDRFGL